MNTRTGKSQESKSRSVANADSKKQGGGKVFFQFVDNRREAIAQRKLQEIAKNSLQTKQTTPSQLMAGNGSVKQRQAIDKRPNLKQGQIKDQFGLDSLRFEKAEPVIQRRMVILGDVGQGEQVESDDLSVEDIRTHLQDNTLPARTRKHLKNLEHDKAFADRPPNYNALVVAHYVEGFNNSMKQYPNVALDTGIGPKVTLLWKTLEKEGVALFDVEDYREPVFSMGGIDTELKELNKLLAPDPERDQADINRTKNLAADILLACTLIVSVERQRKFLGDYSSHFSLYSIDVINPNQAASTLQAMRVQLVQANTSDNVFEANSLAGLNLDDTDTITQRYLKLALLNTTPLLQQSLGDDELFGEIMDSGRIGQFMLTSTGALEQDFLSTCALTARTVDMASNAATIAVLLAAGRRLATKLNEEVSAKANQDKAAEQLTFKQTVSELVLHRVADAKSEFDAIEVAARAMINNKSYDADAMKALTRQWSRSMQKLGAVVNWKDPENLPQLSRKVVKDRWNTSAALGLGGGLTYGLFNPKARTKKRYTPPDSDTYDKVTEESIKKVSSAAEESVEEQLKVTNAAQMWTNLLRIGGTTIAHPGHGLYVKAITRNGVKLYAVNDVLQRTWNYYTIEEWPVYVQKKGICGPAELKG